MWPGFRYSVMHAISYWSMECIWNKSKEARSELLMFQFARMHKCHKCTASLTYRIYLVWTKKNASPNSDMEERSDACAVSYPTEQLVLPSTNFCSASIKDFCRVRHRSMISLEYNPPFHGLQCPYVMQLHLRSPGIPTTTTYHVGVLAVVAFTTVNNQLWCGAVFPRKKTLYVRPWEIDRYRNYSWQIHTTSNQATILPSSCNYQGSKSHYYSRQQPWSPSCEYHEKKVYSLLTTTSFGHKAPASDQYHRQRPKHICIPNEGINVTSRTVPWLNLSLNGNTKIEGIIDRFPSRVICIHSTINHKLIHFQPIPKQFVRSIE